jgi:hypothetical protein
LRIKAGLHAHLVIIPILRKEFPFGKVQTVVEAAQDRYGEKDAEPYEDEPSADRDAQGS